MFFLITQIINVTVVLMTSMLGYFEFRLCAYKKSSKELVTQECLDRHLLTMADGTTRYQIADHQDNTNQIVSLKLPHGNVNCEHCVLQWRYYTGIFSSQHSCVQLFTQSRLAFSMKRKFLGNMRQWDQRFGVRHSSRVPQLCRRNHPTVDE